MICHRDGEAIDIEAAPADFDVLTPDRGMLVHTNHFTSMRLTGFKDLGKIAFIESPIRLARAKKLFEAKRGRIGLSEIQSVLRDHFNRPKSICRHEDMRDEPGRRSETVFSVIMDLNAQKLHLTDGPPCETEYDELKADF
jgi:isopenicillin-N N-acyltransferase-like protein